MNEIERGKWHGNLVYARTHGNLVYVRAHGNLKSLDVRGCEMNLWPIFKVPKAFRAACCHPLAKSAKHGPVP